MNYTKIKITFPDNTELYISEDELVVYQLAGGYWKIEYLNDEDQWHRTDGPAVEWASGSKWWHKNGDLHREGGLPAIEWASGNKEWWENGERIIK